jgi:endonuclease YncB( thermonuclease family)
MNKFKKFRVSTTNKTIMIAVMLSFGALSAGSANAEEHQIDHAPVASIESAAVQMQPAMAPVESTIHYRVHRSPLRSDSLAFHVVSMDGSEELRIELPRIEALSFNKICRSVEGARVACGSRARIQFVNLIARREVTCQWMATPGQPKALQGCAVDGRDLAEFIVRNGLGRAVGDERLAAAANEARQAERGMWVDAELRRGVAIAQN